MVLIDVDFQRDTYCRRQRFSIGTMQRPKAGLIDF